MTDVPNGGCLSHPRIFLLITKLISSIPQKKKKKEKQEEINRKGTLFQSGQSQ